MDRLKLFFIALFDMIIVGTTFTKSVFRWEHVSVNKPQLDAFLGKHCNVSACQTPREYEVELAREWIVFGISVVGCVVILQGSIFLILATKDKAETKIKTKRLFLKIWWWISSVVVLVTASCTHYWKYSNTSGNKETWLEFDDVVQTAIVVISSRVFAMTYALYYDIQLKMCQRVLDIPTN